jgi:NAD(P)-dependent dehydrogenase (short-subunit alcohol dehydrogenase family)
MPSAPSRPFREICTTTAARSAAEELVAAGHKALRIRCNVAEESDVACMMQQVISTYGRADAAFNNAGIHVVRADTADAEGSDFDRIIAVNLRGVFNCMKHELRQMLTPE